LHILCTVEADRDSAGEGWVPANGQHAGEDEVGVPAAYHLLFEKNQIPGFDVCISDAMKIALSQTEKLKRHC
jgi:hypothetical protein